MGCRHRLSTLQHSSATPTYVVWHLHIAECLIWTLHFFDLRKMLHYLSLLLEGCVSCSLLLLLTLCSTRSDYDLRTPCSKHSQPPKAESKFKTFLLHDAVFDLHTPACLYQGIKQLALSPFSTAYILSSVWTGMHICIIFV